MRGKLGAVGRRLGVKPRAKAKAVLKLDAAQSPTFFAVWRARAR
tara:strand:- start:654 stop:785 length:132 start_codon:yes stop_codon:yes gene_type:complete